MTQGRLHRFREFLNGVPRGQTEPRLKVVVPDELRHSHRWRPPSELTQLPDDPPDERDVDLAADALPDTQ